MRLASRSARTGDLPAARTLEVLRARGATLATAESLTGGRLASLVTAVPGASDVFRGGVVAYATDVKVEVLGVPVAVVERYGVVSPECASEMARAVRALMGATYGLSTTGVAGPDSQEGKPVGTVYVGLAGPDGSTAAVALELVGDRAAIQDRTCLEALDCLVRTVQGELPGEEPALR
ncbi:CinA family protein [Nocardioides agariphilus]|uniref:CinA family protein n=1 Tax=Nocardioides agariphilus TaxID=433664 RepID=UPI0035218532